MEINFDLTDEIDKFWEKFMNEIWHCSKLIKIAYSPKIGQVIIELSPYVKNKYLRVKKYFISLANESKINEEILYNIVKKIFEKNDFKNALKKEKKLNHNTDQKINNFFLKNEAYYKELKISLQNEITTYLHYYLQLCIVLGEEKFLPWFYNHFIQICFRIDKKAFFYEKEYATIDFLENKLLFSEVADIRYYGYDAKDIICNTPVNYLIEKINEGNYIITYLDEYHLSKKELYKIHHYVHQSLIYGYDINNGIFLAIGFDKNNVLNKMQYKFDELNAAFNDAVNYYKFASPWSENSAIQLFKLKNFINYPEFNLYSFYLKINEYINAKGSVENVHNYYNGENIYYGINTYNEFSQYLKFITKGINKIDYRAIHILYEHKKAIYKRLQYIYNKFNFDSKYLLIINKYSNIVNKFNAIRLNILKKCVNNCNCYNEMYKLINDNNFIKHIINFIENIGKEEISILNEISKYLDNYLNSRKVLV